MGGRRCGEDGPRRRARVAARRGGELRGCEGGGEGREGVEAGEEAGGEEGGVAGVGERGAVGEGDGGEGAEGEVGGLGEEGEDGAAEAAEVVGGLEEGGGALEVDGGAEDGGLGPLQQRLAVQDGRGEALGQVQHAEAGRQPQELHQGELRRVAHDHHAVGVVLGAGRKRGGERGSRGSSRS